MEERIVSLFDIHVPFNIPLNNVFEFIHDFKPHKVILGGDIHDWTAASQWIADQSQQLDGDTIFKSYEQLHDVVLNPLLNAIPKFSSMIYLTGNHEYWLAQAAGINRNGRGYWELDRNISLTKYRMKIIPLNVPYRVTQHLYYMHGVYTVKYHAEKTAMVYQKNILYGHVHDQQTYTLVSPIDSQPTKAMSCGCLCNRNPRWLKNKPNRWVHGFNYAYVDTKTGLFNDFQVNIIEGKFWANGRRYA